MKINEKIEFSGDFIEQLYGRNQQEKDELLWETLSTLQGKTFSTAKGLDFTYSIKGGEMFVSRRSKSITQATVFMSFHKALELGADATGPKKLGTFGASYLYPIFLYLQIVPGPGKRG